MNTRAAVCEQERASTEGWLRRPEGSGRRAGTLGPLRHPGAALTATGHIVGTSLYLAPERALGRTAGQASDVYSLGCLLYQLLTGSPPFQADSALAVLHQHLDSIPVPPRQLGADLPPAFENYLLGLLAKEPASRPTAEEVADWFGRGAWRGAPVPLPNEHQDHSRPDRPHATGSRAGAPASSVSAPTAQSEGAFGTVADTEWQISVHRVATRRSQLPFLRRSRLVAVLGGVGLFLGSLLVGMVWFSPGTGSAQGPQTMPSASASPATSSSSAATPPPSTASSPPAQPAKQKPERAPDIKPAPKQADKHGKGKH